MSNNKAKDVLLSGNLVYNATNDDWESWPINALGTPRVGLDNGTNFIGRSGANPFKASASFTRPANTTAYALGQAMTNSTSAPTVLSADLASFGAVAGQAFQVTNARIISRNGTASVLNANIWMFNKTFTATNDGAALAIDNTTSELGGIVIPCANAFNNATNSRVVSDAGLWEGFLDAADTHLFFELQASSAYTPISGEVITVILEGVLL